MKNVKQEKEWCRRRKGTREGQRIGLKVGGREKQEKTEQKEDGEGRERLRRGGPVEEVKDERQKNKRSRSQKGTEKEKED